MDYSDFFKMIAGDTRITPLHISLYMTLIYLKELSFTHDALYVYSCEVRFLAKVSSSTTFRKGMRDLQAFGYIVYEPSFDPAKGSRVILVEKKMDSGGKDASEQRFRSF